MNLRVISASRRIDMVGTQPRKLAEILRTKHQPSEVHTLVIWTKNPLVLLHNRSLRETVSDYTQLFVHCTITGMGNTVLEPATPPIEEALYSLRELIALAGSPERVRLRFDPIVHLVFPDGRKYSNLPHFRRVASVASNLGIPAVIVSWVELYPKVISRLEREGIEAEIPSERDIASEREYLLQECAANHLKLLGCCVQGLESSRCIDGALFSRLHPLGLKCSQAKAKGQRPLCTCTDSLDIGWYTPCSHGCLYCYANPSSKVPRKDKAWPH
jgi:DNA repair photolyase